MAIIGGNRQLAHSDKNKTPNEWDNFYGRLKEIKDTNKRFTPIVELPSNTSDYFQQGGVCRPEQGA